jgi:hypothetical protein
MRSLLPALLLLAASAARAELCYYNHRARVVERHYPKCLGPEEAKLSESALFSFSCGVRNAGSLFSDMCKNPCAAALKGIRAYEEEGKTVVYGPALLPTSESTRFAFVLYSGSCSELRREFERGSKPELEKITDDHLISASERLGTKRSK